ncbi:MAG: hypothetical protein E4H07_08765 [Nitrosomonadales bacterium]|nr:MAG: hypothetical protein E4H07_08765 [Nitrosomonadales bacterium]
MSARSKIVDTIVTKLKAIDGTGVYKSDLSNNVSNILKFYDELSDFPFVSVISGYENREYLPGDFRWGNLNISIKVYVQNEYAQAELEKTLADIEYVISENEQLVYDGTNQTTEILITSIQTDEGVLNPIGVGEINLVAKYQVMSHNP